MRSSLIAITDEFMRGRLRSIASESLSRRRRSANKGALAGLGAFAVSWLIIFSMVPCPRLEAAHAPAWLTLFMGLGGGGVLALCLRAALVRDVHQLEKLIEHGTPNHGHIASKVFAAKSPLGAPSDTTVVWWERGRRVTACMKDREDVIDGDASRYVVVLTRGCKRWVGVVVDEKLILALRPRRVYHPSGN